MPESEQFCHRGNFHVTSYRTTAQISLYLSVFKIWGWPAIPHGCVPWMWGLLHARARRSHSAGQRKMSKLLPSWGITEQPESSAGGFIISFFSNCKERVHLIGLGKSLETFHPLPPPFLDLIEFFKSCKKPEKGNPPLPPYGLVLTFQRKIK